MLQSLQSQFQAAGSRAPRVRPRVPPTTLSHPHTEDGPVAGWMRQLLVLSRGRPNSEQAYLQWCAGSHLSNMMAIPGIAEGAIHRLCNADEGAEWQVASLFGLEAPTCDILAEMFERAETAAMPLSESLDDRKVLMLDAEPIGPRRLAPAGGDRCDGLLFIVLTNPVAGEDKAFNHWYDEEHLDDVLATPGVVSAQRFRIAPETAGRRSPWEYLAIFEVAPEIDARAIDLISARDGAAEMAISPALDGATVYAGLFELERQVLV